MCLLGACLYALILSLLLLPSVSCQPFGIHSQNLYTITRFTLLLGLIKMPRDKDYNIMPILSWPRKKSAFGGGFYRSDSSQVRGDTCEKEAENSDFECHIQHPFYRTLIHT